MALRLTLSRNVKELFSSFSRKSLTTSCCCSTTILPSGRHGSNVQSIFSASFPYQSESNLWGGRWKIPPLVTAPLPLGIAIRDPLVDRFAKEILTPSVASHWIKVYQDNPSSTARNISDPPPNKCEISEAPMPGRTDRKEAVRMIRIRKRKMKKHKLRKWRKKYHAQIVKKKMQRELRKEQDFRMELLSQVEAADLFNAKEYVEGIIHKLRYHPKPEPWASIMERHRMLRKKNKHNVIVVTPRFDY